MCDIAPRWLLLGFDGLVCGSDLPVQAFARHCAAALPVDRGRVLVGGMRGVLEDRTDLLPGGIRLDGAEDGFDVVEILASAMGLDAARIAEARQRARLDLAGSAWAVEPAAGLPELLVALRAAARVRVVAADAAGVTEVLEATGLDGFVDASDVFVDPGGAGWASAVRAAAETTGAPDRVLAVATRWADLASAADAGGRTALIDRFGRGRGAPTLRARDFAGLASAILSWAGAGEVVR